MEDNKKNEKEDELNISYFLKQIPTPSKKNLIRSILVLVLGIVILLVVSYLLTLIYPYLEYYAELGYIGLFIAVFVASASFFLPLPGLAVVLAAATVLSPGWVALVASIASTLGELSGYLLGRYGINNQIKERMKMYSKAERWVQRYGVFAVWLFAAFPLLIFDVLAVAAGAFRLSVWKFLLATWLGRLPRSYIEVYLGLGIMHIIFPFMFH
jgi:membrane protein YqaA with SNARE-associated domain